MLSFEVARRALLLHRLGFWISRRDLWLGCRDLSCRPVGFLMDVWGFRGQDRRFRGCPALFTPLPQRRRASMSSLLRLGLFEFGCFVLWIFLFGSQFVIFIVDFGKGWIILWLLYVTCSNSVSFFFDFVVYF